MGALHKSNSSMKGVPPLENFVAKDFKWITVNITIFIISGIIHHIFNKNLKAFF